MKKWSLERAYNEQALYLSDDATTDLVAKVIDESAAPLLLAAPALQAVAEKALEAAVDHPESIVELEDELRAALALSKGGAA